MTRPGIAAGAVAWLAARPGTVLYRDGAAIIVLAPEHLAALPRMLERAMPETVLTGADHELFALLAEIAREGRKRAVST